MNRSKWISIGLIVSLIVNLLLVGFIVGRASQAPFAMGPDPTMAFPRFARDLPEDRRQAIRPHVRKHLTAMRPNRQALHQARVQINQAIVAEPYEPEALAQALANMHQVQIQLSQSTQLSFVQFVSALTPAERSKFVQRNKRHIKPRHRVESDRHP